MVQQVVAPGPNSVQLEQFDQVVQGLDQPAEADYVFNFETGAVDERT